MKKFFEHFTLFILWICLLFIMFLYPSFENKKHCEYVWWSFYWWRYDECYLSWQFLQTSQVDDIIISENIKKEEQKKQNYINSLNK